MHLDIDEAAVIPLISTCKTAAMLTAVGIAVTLTNDDKEGKYESRHRLQMLVD